MAENLASAKFFSVLMDGSTDKSNIDDELFLVLWCDVDGIDEKVHTRMRAVARPDTVTASGLFECLQTKPHFRGLGYQPSMLNNARNSLALEQMVQVPILHLLA